MSFGRTDDEADATIEAIRRSGAGVRAPAAALRCRRVTTPTRA